MEDSTVIKLDDLTTGYTTSRGRVIIQKNICSELHRSEFTCLLGPNGAGKTTLLRTLGGFLAPLSGVVCIDNKEIGEISRDALSKKVGVVLTERPSVSTMTVEQLVALGRSPYTDFWGRLTNKDKSIVEQSLVVTDSMHLRHRLVDTLSDGERQKVMIAKALAQQTQIILLDEPTAFLDYPTKAEMMRLLRNLAHEQHKTIFLSTHDLNMAIALADKLWLVDRKLGVNIGSPLELAGSGTLQEYFQRPGLVFDSDRMMFVIE